MLLSLFLGGNTSLDNNPKHDGDDGTSILGPDGEPFLYPLKGNSSRMVLLKTQPSVQSNVPKLHLTPLKCLWVRARVFVEKQFWKMTFWIKLIFLLPRQKGDLVKCADNMRSCFVNRQRMAAYLPTSALHLCVWTGHVLRWKQCGWNFHCSYELVQHLYIILNSLFTEVSREIVKMENGK